MRYAQINNDIVENIIIAEPDVVTQLPGTFILLANSEGCSIGWRYDPNATPRFIEE